MEEVLWVTRDGRSMNIRDMTNAHLLNALNYFVKLGRQNSYRCQLLFAENKRRKNLPKFKLRRKCVI